MTIREIIIGISIGFLLALIIMGGLYLWYVIDETSLCQKYEKANPNINFKYEFSTGCMFELLDETWVNLRDYKRFSQYKLRIKCNDR